MADPITRAVSEISHRCDGPVTPFVAMARATALVAQGKATDEDAANALYVVLMDMGVDCRTDIDTAHNVGGS